jgi:hypothetical protein
VVFLACGLGCRIASGWEKVYIASVETYNTSLHKTISNSIVQHELSINRRIVALYDLAMVKDLWERIGATLGCLSETSCDM